MGEEPEEYPWLKIDEPPLGVVSAEQEEAIRRYAELEGFPTLRGFHMRLKMMEWDYYDVLAVASP